MKGREQFPANGRKGRKTMANYEMTMELIGGRREELSQPEFIGEGLHTIDEAIDAANDAVEYVGGGVSFVGIYRDDVYVGYVQDGKFYRDCDCDIELD
jgi:hypothetical protein